MEKSFLQTPNNQIVEKVQKFVGVLGQIRGSFENFRGSFDPKVPR